MRTRKKRNDARLKRISKVKDRIRTHEKEFRRQIKPSKLVGKRL